MIVRQDLIEKIWKAYVILPLITLFCLAGFIGSLLFPNKVLDTYVINMSEEEGDTEILLPLSHAVQRQVAYRVDTSGRPMRGIQIGINKQGREITGSYLRYQVYAGEKIQRMDMAQITAKGQLLSDSLYDLSQGDNLQYVYLPFTAYEKCAGNLVIVFSVEPKEEGAADGEEIAIMANHHEVEKTETCYVTDRGDYAQEDYAQVEAINRDLSLKCSHIYTHNTYPFLYDFRILTFVFLAASMAVSYPAVTRWQIRRREKRRQQRKQKKGGKIHETV